jgi:hypothetical protein
MINRKIDLRDDLANSLDFPNIDYCQFVRKAAGTFKISFEYLS